MESLEIGMTWNASPYAPQSDDSSREIETPDQRVLLSTEDSRAGPSNAERDEKGTATTTPDTLGTEGREEFMKGGNDTHETGGLVSKGLESITSKSSKKRKMKLGIEEDILNRFGPPRQSIRARIKVEFQTPPDPPKETVNSPKSKKAKNLERSVMTDPAQVTKDLKMCKTDKRRKRKKDSKSRTAKKEKKSILTDIRPSMMLTEDDIKADEIIAHRPVSLESMGTAGAVTKTNGRTLEQRLQEKKRKDRKIIVSEPKEDSDADIPLVEIGSLDDPGPIPVKRGIQSSTFARVMRLVADLPRCEVRPKKTKRLVPEHRPLVWAMSRQELCEALPYYRAFQSGLYLHQGVAFGYLLDGFPAPRDACAHNARVIISHGGGHCVRPTLDDGQVLPPVLAGDQLVTDFRVATLVRAWKRRVPLVLIAGSGYELLPFKLSCSYAVLGWYWVSMVWTEAEPVAQGIKSPIGRAWFKRVKVRFDWVESQGVPWWEQSAGPAPQQTNSYEEAIVSPEAKRIQVSELVVAESDQKDMGDLDHRPASMFFGALPAQNLRPLYPLNPKSGLLTPPITPPTLSSHMLTAETTRLTEGNVAKLNETKRRRLPGDYLLAAVKGKVDVTASMDPYSDIRKQCQFCRGDNPIIYTEGWMCLNTKCTAYWMLETNIGLLPIPPGLKLSYHPQYLKPAPTPRDVKPAYDVVPPRPKSGIPDEAGPGDSAGSRSLWRGWVCENCGRANCRFRWEVWQCLGCKKLLAPIDPYSAVIPAGSLGGPEKAMLGDPKIDSSARISVSMRRIQDPAATVMIYTLPDRIGTVYHVINDCNDFADGIFDRYQREAASTRVPLFQRRPLNAHQIRGQLLAQHFAVNSGVSYKYNVDSLSLSFDDSPSCVIQALDAITLKTERVVANKIDFNEVLSVLYREGQKMSWHDDGEPGLGPVVAGLSLGSSATISWRRKSAHTHANASFNKGMPDPRKEPISPIALSLTTSHGDIVMMEGREMQKKYVHRVIPNGFRVAATARVIGK